MKIDNISPRIAQQLRNTSAKGGGEASQKASPESPSARAHRTAPGAGQDRVEAKKEEMAVEFERMFTRQLVQEMTKDLFKQDDNKGIMSSGSEMYRSHIVDTLSQALAEQKELGMADMISRHWDPRKE